MGVGSQTYRDRDLGPVHVRALATARRFSARWKGGELYVTIPAGIPAAEFNRVMDDWKPRLLEIRPAQTQKYHIGYRFANDVLAFTIVEDADVPPRSVRSRYIGHPGGVLTFDVAVAPGTDMADTAIAKTISKLIAKVCTIDADSILPAEARAEAARLGLERRITGYSVGRGVKRLGTCSSHGHITLSNTLMFYPRRLRRSTILHELAHLTHFDHSPAFKALWDSYLGYSHTEDKALIAKLDLPILR